MSDRIGGCKEFAKRFDLVLDCCSSCHEDFDMGYHQEIDIEWMGGWHGVCCRMANQYKQEQDTQAKESKDATQ